VEATVHPRNLRRSHLDSGRYRGECAGSASCRSCPDDGCADGRTADGRPAGFRRRSRGPGVDVVGVNSRSAPDDSRRWSISGSPRPDSDLARRTPGSRRPSGLGRSTWRARVTWPSTPGNGGGGRPVVGGCCGTTPPLKAIVGFVQSVSPRHRATLDDARSQGLGRRRADAPRGIGPARPEARLKAVQSHGRECRLAAPIRFRCSRNAGRSKSPGSDAVNVPDGPGRRAGWARCLRAHDRAGRSDRNGDSSTTLPRSQPARHALHLLGAAAGPVSGTGSVTGDPPTWP